MKAVRIFTSCPGVSSSCSSWVVGPNWIPCRVPCQASYRVPCRVRVGLVGVHHTVLVLSAGQEDRSPVEVPVLLGPFVLVQVVQVVRRKVVDPGLRIRLCLDPGGKGQSVAVAVAAVFFSRRLARSRPCHRLQSSRQKAARRNQGNRSIRRDA